MNGLIKSTAALILLALIIFGATKIFGSNSSFEKDIKKNLSGIKNEIELKINDPTEYNGLKKSDIYELRKKYVNNSLFASKKYEPNDYIFGQIEDNRPWYGLKYHACTHSALGTEKVIEGPSEESRFINNPNMLIGLSCGGISADVSQPICTNKHYWFMPTNLSYNGKTKTIHAMYIMPYSQSCQLTGINARDFGYNYIYANYVKDIKFTNSKNIANSIYSFRDYIHKGNSCKLPNGCNNASPRQAEVEFEYQPEEKGLSIMNFKLWHDMPKSKRGNADIKYSIMILSD